MQKHKSAKARSSDGRALVLGLGSAAIVMILMLIASAICIINEYLTLDSIGLVSLIIQFVCVSVGTFTAGMLVKDNRERMILVVSSILYLLQLCCALLFFDEIKNTFWVNLLITALAAISTMLILCRRKAKTKNGSIIKRR